MLQNIKEMIEKPIQISPELDVHIGISMGISQNRGDLSGAEVLAEADQALYRAKEEGKSRIVYNLPDPSAADEMV